LCWESDSQIGGKDRTQFSNTAEHWSCVCDAGKYALCSGVGWGVVECWHARARSAMASTGMFRSSVEMGDIAVNQGQFNLIKHFPQIWVYALLLVLLLRNHCLFLDMSSRAFMLLVLSSFISPRHAHATSGCHSLRGWIEFHRIFTVWEG